MSEHKIVVIEKPEKCWQCDCCYEKDGEENCCLLKTRTDLVDECPLADMPKYRDENTAKGIAEELFNEGWNACIEKIMDGDPERLLKLVKENYPSNIRESDNAIPIGWLHKQLVEAMYQRRLSSDTMVVFHNIIAKWKEGK